MLNQSAVISNMKENNGRKNKIMVLVLMSQSYKVIKFLSPLKCRELEIPGLIVQLIEKKEKGKAIVFLVFIVKKRGIISFFALPHSYVSFTLFVFSVLCEEHLTTHFYLLMQSSTVTNA